jgi:hypothetical protein
MAGKRGNTAVAAGGPGFLCVFLGAAFPAASGGRMGVVALGNSFQVATDGAMPPAGLRASTASASRSARVSNLAGTVTRYVALLATAEATAGESRGSTLCKAPLTVFHHAVEVAIGRHVVEAGFLERAPPP